MEGGLEVQRGTSYKRIDFIVRPHKLCMLIDSRVPHWREQYKRIVEIATTLWGGKNMIIIPTNGSGIEDYSWRIMEAFSPDCLAVYSETVADLKIYDPPAYGRWVDEQRQRLDGLDEDRFNQMIAENETALRLRGNLELSEDLKKELYERLCPNAHSAHHVIEHHFHYNDIGGWPLTHSTDILDLAKEPLEVVYAPKGNDDPDLSVMESMMTGRISSVCQDALTSKGVEIRNLPDTMTVGEELSDIIRGDGFYARLRTNEQPDRGYIHQMPYSISMLGLQRGYRIVPHHRSREGVLLVIGDSVDDLCLAHNLSVLQENVYWISSGLVEETSRESARVINARQAGEEAQVSEKVESVSDIIRAYVSKMGYGMNEDKYPEIISVTLSRGQLRRRVDMMKGITATPDAFDNTKYPNTNTIDLSNTPIVMEAGNYTAQQAMVFVDGKSVHILETPKPINFETVTDNFRWVTSFKVEGYKAPMLSFAGKSVVDDGRGGMESRVDKERITYLSPGIAWFNANPVDANIVKPKVKLIDAQETFNELFGVNGYNVTTSDKGMYMRHTIELFGSLEEAARYLKLPGVLKFLKMLTKKKQNPENRNERIFLDYSNRTYVDLAQINRVTGGNVDTGTLIDEWTGKGILKRGVILQCKRCACAAWYAAGAFDEGFTCQRCGNNERIRRENWKMPDEPKWYYSLDETVHQFIYNNGDVPLLTLDHLRAKSDYFDYVTEIKLINRSDGKEIELDVACLVDGEVYLGEAKSGEFVPSFLRPMQGIENLLSPVPFTAVFSTSQPSVSAIVKTAISRGFRKNVILERRDIY